MVKRRKKRRRGHFWTYVLTFLAIVAGGAIAQDPSVIQHPTAENATALVKQVVQAGQLKTNQTNQVTAPKQSVDAKQLATETYRGTEIVAVNHNQPTFTKADLSLGNGAWQKYGNLDRLNRVTAANAMLQRDLMPTAKREALVVSPTGWHNKEYTVNGKRTYLYNRSHLIGYQLTGQNNNVKNLMTGTRDLNAPDMENYESKVAAYLKQTDNHVRYQVEPVFRNDELVARGVHMQAQSIETGDIKFNIYIFNVQPGITINYQTGYSQKE
ncbi:DNA/RNA non-specific endonuclease [Levilactobacillus bambusae]|uniref:DNA-entry nuclease n=1 Tax=Levilactobacillus bambusae TaxID=2024736 RepID=A0A2V1N0E9_9LACO|nr:DNA/RNA non-specific endonuclease [Levilactobacillus bambusae]PWG00542.1 DNA-entry nuclease [Levilactobacillus bambusae]